jgi:hypothetical protein
VTTDDGTISSYAGTVATPLKIEAPTQIMANSGGMLLTSTGDHIATVSSDTYTLANECSSYASFPSLVVDSGEREAFIKVPHAVARRYVYDAVWYYRMNESAGTTIDNYEGTSGYDGTTSGTPTLNQAGPFTDSASIYFDGVNDHISRAYVSAMYPSSDFTFEIWVKPYSGSAGGTFVDMTDADDGFRIYESSGYAGIVIGLGATSLDAGFTTLTHSVWNHLAITYSAGVVRGYHNGELKFSTRAAYSRPTTGTMYLGGLGGLTWWKGNLSGAGMYAQAFPASVIADMYSDAAAMADVRHGIGAYIDDVSQWLTLSGALTLAGMGSIDDPTATMVTTYRTARL